MKCNQAKENLSAWVDGELKGQTLKDLEFHVSSCGVCQKEKDSLLVFKQLLQGEFSSVKPTHDFEARFWQKAYAREKRSWKSKILEALDSFLPAPNFAVVSAMILIALLMGGTGGVVSAMTPSKIHTSTGKLSVSGLSGSQEVKGIPSMSLSANYFKMLERKDMHS